MWWVLNEKLFDEKKRNKAMIDPTTEMSFEYLCCVTKADNKGGHVVSL